VCWTPQHQRNSALLTQARGSEGGGSLEAGGGQGLAAKLLRWSRGRRKKNADLAVALRSGGWVALECQTLEQPGPFLWASGGGLVWAVPLEAVGGGYAGGFCLALWGSCTALVPLAPLGA